jgi:uncharacterized membrane protein YeiH
MGNFSILLFLCYVGDIAFFIGGILAAKRMGLKMPIQFASGLSVFSFGGFWFRDLIILRTTPSILSSPLEIAAVSIIGIIAINLLNRHNSVNSSLRKVLLTILYAADAAAVAGFAAFGYGRGILAGMPCRVCFACAFVTTCGGGFISIIIRAAAAKDFQYFLKTVIANKFYYLFGAFVSAVYTVLYAHGKDTDISLSILALCAIVIGLLVEKEKAK